MKTLLLSFVLAAACPGANHRDWREGKVTASARATQPGVPVTVINGGATLSPDPAAAAADLASRNAQAAAATAAARPRHFQYYTIEAAGYRFLVAVLLGRHPPNVTVNGTVKFATEKAAFYFVDDDGREFRAEVVEKKLLTPMP